MSKRVIVVGGGVVGVTTAWFLRARGHEVILIERQKGLGEGASFANGAQLSYSFTDALAEPGLLLQLPKMLLGIDPAFRLRLSADPAFWRWSFRFLRQCTRTRADRTTLTLLELAMESARLMTQLAADASLPFLYARRGKLILLNGDVTRAERMCALKRAHGCEVRIVSREESIEIEPALSRMTTSHSAAVWASEDTAGDCNSFTRSMGCQLVEHNTRVVTEAAVERILGDKRGVKGVCLRSARGQQKIAADAVVICAGIASPVLVAPFDIHLCMYPMRGYSWTVPAVDDALQRSITVSQHKMVFTRLGDNIRVAGFLDTRKDLSGARLDLLLKTARTVAPEVARYDAACNGWEGVRPMTPDGLPYLGPTSVPGLYLNTGHGMLGWTLAAGCANRISEAVTND